MNTAMLDLKNKKKDNTFVNLEVSEEIYQKLAEAGLDKIVNYSEYTFCDEAETFTIEAVKLDFDSRDKILRLLTNELINDLLRFFDLFKNPTVKEMRQNLKYVKILVKMYLYIKNEEITFFSYE